MDLNKTEEVGKYEFANNDPGYEKGITEQQTFIDRPITNNNGIYKQPKATNILNTFKDFNLAELNRSIELKSELQKIKAVDSKNLDRALNTDINFHEIREKDVVLKETLQTADNVMAPRAPFHLFDGVNKKMQEQQQNQPRKNQNDY